MKRLNKSETLPEGIRRLLAAHIQDALSQLSSSPGDEKAIHEARKSLKRSRSLLRLVRAAVGEVARTQNRALASVGRKLSQARDSQVLLESLNKIESTSGVQFPAARKHLRRPKRENGRSSLMAVRLLERAQRNVSKLSLSDVSFGTLEAGLRQTIKRGKKAFAAACQQPSGEAYHDLRKRVKDLRYQLEVVSGWWPDVLEAYVHAARRLEQDLGNDHDLHILAEKTGSAQPEILPYVETAQARLRKKILRQATLLYSDRPKIWRRRLEESWKAAAA